MQDKYFNTDQIKLYKNWTDQEWPFAIRWYDLKTGNISVEKTLKDINKNVNVPYKELPNDINSV